MAVRKVTFRLNDALPDDKYLLDWIDKVYTDRSVPLKVHLIPVIRRGLERFSGGADGVDEVQPRQRIRRNSSAAASSEASKVTEVIKEKKATIETIGSDISAMAGADDDEVALDKLSFD